MIALEFKWLKKVKLFKNYTTKIKLSFVIYADFESTLISENNEKKNPDESYTKKYQNHISCSYVYKLVYVDDKFSKPFKLYLGQDDLRM